jgi:RNA polymerase sigma-32 factor
MQIPNLEPDEEVTLAKRWRERGDVAARNKLTSAQLKLVLAMACEHCRHPQELEDLVSVGNNALMEAPDKFEPDKGFRFNTYARWSIMGALRRYLRQDLGVVKPCEGHDTPKYMFLDKPHAHKDEDGSDAWQDRLMADGTDTSVINLERGEKGNTSQLRHQEESIIEALDEARCIEMLREAANSALNDRDRQIFQARHRDDDSTFEKLSGEFGTSSERVRQIYERSVERVQNEMRANPKVQQMVIELQGSSASRRGPTIKTRRNTSKAPASFSDWCEHHGLLPLQASVETVVSFLAAARSETAPAPTT